MNTVTLACNAMASRFEMVIIGEDPHRLRAAGEEALAEIDRIEAQLSLFRSSSEVARINALAAREPVRLSPEVFNLLKRAVALSQESGGAFDITVAPLVNAWGFMDGVPRQPDPDEVDTLRERVGFKHLVFDEKERTIFFDVSGVMVDFGAIGKGYAVERAADLLREAGIERALLHGGTSTIYAIGTPPDAEGWRIGIEEPMMSSTEDQFGMRRLKSAAVLPITNRPVKLLFEVLLEDMALSVSSPSGKCYEAGGQIYGHIIDPVTAQPGTGGLFAAVMLQSATDTDALSTALLISGKAGYDRLKRSRPEMKAWYSESGTRVVGGG